ncbi:hypothetical protein AVEN_187129-1 [Araneus ventricosus]|uniref:PiggyBac transposable element-derived protein domain-containing protein n=1 Tax=Araneus ventricosus TaxID=182803 RepID=A0A4Y2V3E1_ARAVE|nr:hypothetical protein AVEN_67803-1 [Araneus ventricosus]GBO19748.1 hypothetical protein AVEN_187129-1 [Araneus ventricosus]
MRLIRSVRCFSFRIEVFNCFSQCRLHTKKKWSAYVNEVETDDDPDFDEEDNGPEDVLEENFSDHDNFSEHDAESEEDVDSGNEETNNKEWFSSKDGVQWRKFRQNIRTLCHNIVSRLPETKEPAKDVTSPVKSWELFIDDNMVQLMVECTNIFIEKCAPNLSRERVARKKGPSRNPCFIRGQ